MISFRATIVSFLAVALIAVGPATGAALAKGGGGTSGGGSSVSLPADFPTADVPLPAGKLFGSTGSSPSWAVGLTLNAGLADAMASVQSFYLAQGFTEPAGEFSVYTFTRGSYQVQAVGANHDHSASATDVTFVVHLL